MEKTSILKHASVIIGLILSSLYATGLLHHIEYLTRLGVEETQFQLSIERMFFQGFIFLADILSKSIFHFLIAAVAIYFLTLISIALVEYLKRKEYVKRLTHLIESHLGQKQPNELENSFKSLAERMVTVTYMMFIGYIIILLVLLLSSSTGKKSAMNFIERIESGEALQHSLLLKSSIVPIMGYPIICSDTQCAYYLDKGRDEHGEALVINKRDIKSQRAINKAN
ncbi:MAG: hypothetical protein ABJH28_05200 [Paraglaciecola sp.]|uniref:hypothetical protein n=1 Tax=Paraglaciecola sp. TaxID=1920173 RepID=UPI00326360F1